MYTEEEPVSVTDELVAANESFAASFAGGGLPGPPSRHVAVVACMDARLDVYRVLGLGDGEAHVIRNAGGVVTDDVLRSLTISQRKLGTTEVVLLHHTKCGMATFDDDEFVAELDADAGAAGDGRRARSPTPSRTSVSRSPPSAGAPSCGTRTPSAASSTTSTRARSPRSRDGWDVVAEIDVLLAGG